MHRVYTMFALLLLGALTLTPLGAGEAGATTNGVSGNTVTIEIRGGDANALAGCLNAADTGNYSSVKQKNYCKNKAYAQGGNLVLRNVVIDVFQQGTGDAPNSVDLTIRGGDANALAACINAAETGNYSSVQQKNYCRSKAYARGGDVILRNVDIIITQLNGPTS